jgi:hypothetical protein
MAGNVTISFDGLAIYHFNESEGAKNWELLFLRHLKNHDLSIKITKFTGDASADDKILIHEFKVGKGHKIFIEAEDTEPTDVVKLVTGDQVDFEKIDKEIDEKEKSNDPQAKDIRWMINLSDSENEVSGCNFKADDVNKRNLTFLSIPTNALLFTKSLSKAKFEIWERTSETTKELRAIRRIGETVAAALQCNSDLRFRVDGVFSYEINLPISDGVSYEIQFDNSCHTPTCEELSDFHHYYELFASDRQLELIPIIPVDKEGKRKPGTVAACPCSSCRKIIGITSLEELV